MPDSSSKSEENKNLMLKVNGHSSKELLGNTNGYVNNARTFATVTMQKCEILECQVQVWLSPDDAKVQRIYLLPGNR